MRAPLSIIIPTLNAERDLPGCLQALWEGLHAEVIRELIVVDGGSDDATVSIARDAGAEVISAPPGRGGQLRRGAQAAKGDWLLFIHADSWLDDCWSDNLRDFYWGENETKAAVFTLRFRAKGIPALCVASWANARTRLVGLPYGDQGLLIPRALYDEVGGYADTPLMEDVDMARKLKGNLIVLPTKILTSADRYLAEGWLRRSLKNGVLLMRYFAGADPKSLARRYARR